ncbi:MAG: DNA modification methylase [Verrucomicrobiaceae bacterium]|nr:DNA modification methylase [Verrucomicrobiaceae bacterium]
MRRSLANRYFDPLVWNRRNGMLISGHLRWKVLQDMGYTHVDVSVVDCDEQTHYALMIHANRHQGEFDEAILVSLLSEIELAGIDAAIAGFDHKAMLALLEPPVIEDDTEQTAELMSKAEELQEKWQVRPGDLYQIGVHRLLCGDCGDLNNLKKLLEDRLADMLWCDPPYNVAYDASARKRNKIKARNGETAQVKPVTILNDNMKVPEYQALLSSWFAAATEVIKPGGAIYIAHADSFGLETRYAARQADWKIAQTLIWVKQAFTLTRQDYEWQHEPILYGWKEGKGHFWQGGFTQSTVIDEEIDLKKMKKSDLVTLVNHLRNAVDGTIVREPRNVRSDLHPTIKPTRLVARHIWNSSRRGETVLELFSGSGTTIEAAEKTGRKARAMELDPKFVAVGCERGINLGLEVVKLHAA